MSKIAKGALLRGVNQPFVVEELVWDDVRDDEIGIKVVACGLCRSDWHVVTGEEPDVPFPALCGHEGTGIVVEVGKDVKNFQVGDHIVMSWMPSCGQCQWCIKGMGQLCDNGANLMSGMRSDGTYRIHTKDGENVAQFSFLGAFSEYVVVPAIGGAVKVPKELDLKKIPIIGCRVPTGVGSVFYSAQAEQGCTALVIGCGGIGHNVIQGLKAVNATIIIAADIYTEKEKTAREFGATHFIDLSKQDLMEEVMKITGIGVDFAFECVGNGNMQAQAIEAVHKNGKVVWVGVAPFSQSHVDMNAAVITLFNKTIIGTCYGDRSPFELIPKLIDMHRAGKIKFDELCTKEYRLEQINEGYADMLAGKNICGVIIMD